MKVLLVDDEEDFVSALAERLQLRGMDVQVALDGESALSLIKTRLPDVVVLDVMMPGLGGAVVLQRIQASHPKLPVLLLTGHGSIASGQAGIKRDVFDYLVKPIDINDLMTKLEKAVRSVADHPDPSEKDE